MRSLKSKVLSAVAWAIPACAVALPSSRSNNDGHAIHSAGAKISHPEIVLQPDYAQATFTIPCPGCLGPHGTSHGHDDDDDSSSITIDFKAHSQDQPCGLPNVTVNGLYLPHEWYGDSASGSASFKGVTDIQENAWYSQHDLDLEWESSCLQPQDKTRETQVTSPDAAQLLSLTIKAIDGKPLENPSGFTISYKQLSPPELLRLERAPQLSAKDAVNAEAWREPPAHLRLTLPAGQENGAISVDDNVETTIEEDIRELKALQAEVEALHKIIVEKQKSIQAKKGNKTLKQELQQCHNITCVVKVIGDKAHGAWDVVYVTIRPGHKSNDSPSDMGRPEDRYHRLGNHKQTPESTKFHDHDSKEKAQTETEEVHASEDSVPDPFNGNSSQTGSKNVYIVALEIIVGVLCCGCLMSVIRHRCSSLRTRTERAARREERDSARAYRRAARKLRWQNWWNGRRTWRDQERIADYEEKRSLISEQESILEDAMQTEIRQLREAHGLVNSLVQAEEGRLSSQFNRPNQQAPCHCRHNPPRLPPQPPHAYYQSHQQPAARDSDAFDTQPLYSPSIASSVYTTNTANTLASLPPSRPLSRTSSLPGYPSSNASTAPPAYESDEDTSDHVADGFRQYTSPITPPSSSSPSPSSSPFDEDDDTQDRDDTSTSQSWTTPDSSVVDVSPRPSADTLRYPESMFTMDSTTAPDVKT
ncbi:hypothetical protein BU24DRAFT_421011 [Aaosphaeria arxii CBS 175.79]|uniref:Uncharacterized protein n=1 Tax=Aaosphaeria arxii CBS 175.79 TaxID=1450172 RepID=A0A6A5XZ55_9PLEO|nr:uncharacterized protein BU24DRAFT_421011 [Aaosphaeria arxii CBS 175.79]KAF2017981.1 hypothetical protein BU24DRAFT_421011 [Aaosphaeria arxii CBS 175.79]